ncbi:hypothetical protein A1Q2_00045 [Trichosporon asahii var. asahii CBS 8904]|uniref:Uncharacterized protein n=1 Tax=Trichosporon asahii var. asahii (strain CBS 8904) TaxID=1220162 RepID=K1WA72_TRIAC|nr:hypothetical protein A1Q2_00045 [Trichosporon asahii var. asahii CBS 8904]
MRLLHCQHLQPVSLYTGLMFGLSLTANLWCFFRISGGLFHPAVTFAFVLIGGITPVGGALLFITQLAGPLYAATILLGRPGLLDRGVHDPPRGPGVRPSARAAPARPPGS